jgi:predicted ATPase
VRARAGGTVARQIQTRPIAMNDNMVFGRNIEVNRLLRLFDSDVDGKPHVYLHGPPDFGKTLVMQEFFSRLQVNRTKSCVLTMRARSCLDE